MGWQDRDYGSGDGGGGGMRYALQQAGSYALPIGTYLNVRVSVHWSFFLILLWRMLADGDAWWALRWSSLLFLSVLLHEFGHVLACRRVGGRADEILMWPLGGLAFCDAPQTPWAQFVTVIWGPLVNVIIAAACYGALLTTHAGQMPVSLAPFNMFQGYAPGLPGLLADLFVVNYSLLLFNLALLFYPFDGGRLVQIALWKKMGYVRSMIIATRVGMIGAVAIALYGIMSQNLMLMMIALFGFMACYQQGQMMQQYDMAGHGRAPYGGHAPYGGQVVQTERKIGWFERRRIKAAARRRAAESEADAKLDAEVDRILAKVKEQGLQSLTDKEKKTLQTATDRQRRSA